MKQQSDPNGAPCPRLTIATSSSVAYIKKKV